MRQSRVLLILAGLIGVAFVLRLYRLDAVPLRGDEAFAVRYWAADPVNVVQDLAHREPHPFGTFFGFWAWKSRAGDTVFAMRYLPLLGNVLGVAVIAALARRLTRSWYVGLMAATLWAINPYLIWHSQDVRNYALWATFSPLAMWLFLRATETNTRRSWTFYAAAQILALYTFFLEAFLLPVQVLYLWLSRRDRRVWRNAIRTWLVMIPLLIPWCVQAWWLAHSDYGGTLGEASFDGLLTWFLPTLLGGNTPPPPWDVILPLAWIVAISLALIPWKATHRRTLTWLADYVLVPTTVLVFAATRMSVFHPRYLLAISPALLILIAMALSLPDRSPRPGQTINAARATMLLVPLLGIMQLGSYYQGTDAKSPDWPALADHLESLAGPDDIILHTVPDPAFNYYYDGTARETSLETSGTSESIENQIRELIASHRTIWLVGDNPQASATLGDTYQQLSQTHVDTFTVTQYRDLTVAPDEIEQTTDRRFGDVARLTGYTLQGPDPVTGQLTVLLYWEPLRQTTTDYKVFVHLLGPPHGPDSIPLWSQDDHAPQDGAASTTLWTPGSLIRDSYTLSLPAQPAGDFMLSIGLYDPADPTQRLPVTTAHGDALGDSLTVPLDIAP